MRIKCFGYPDNFIYQSCILARVVLLLYGFTANQAVGTHQFDKRIVVLIVVIVFKIVNNTITIGMNRTYLLRYFREHKSIITKIDRRFYK